MAAGAYLTPHRFRAYLLRHAGISIAPGCLFFSGITVDFPRNISIGRNVFFNHGVHMDGAGGIVIEEGVRVGPHVRILTSSHETGDETRRAGPLLLKPILIARGAWIGAGATILAGVSIGAGCIIAAGAMVTRDCQPNTLYAGVPALPKKQLDRMSAP